MNDQDIKKMKTSILPPLPEHNDSYSVPSSDENAETGFGPGTTKYEIGDPRLSNWKQISSGGPKSSVVPELNSGVDPLDGLADYSRSVNNEEYTEEMQYRFQNETFRPRTKFERFRMEFEGPKLPTKPLFDTVPYIPSLSKLLQETKDYAYIKSYFFNRLGLLNDKIKFTENELATNTNPHILMARREYLEFLIRKKTFVENQIAEAEIRQDLFSDDDSSPTTDGSTPPESVV